MLLKASTTVKIKQCPTQFNSKHGLDDIFPSAQKIKFSIKELSNTIVNVNKSAVFCEFSHIY